jgi:DNA replication and repair protein RecF
MKICSLFLENFRNYSSKEIHFSPGVNIIIGENGVGKTNILESIFSLAFSKPFRSTKKEVFIKHNTDYSRIKGVLSDEELEIFWGISPRKINVYKKNNIKVSASDYINQKKFLSVLFSPEEMNLPIAAPEQRRKYLSRVLSPLFPEYFDASLKYNSVLKNRNALLKKYFDGEAKKSEFFFWDTELTTYHNILQKYRTQFFEYINTSLSEEYSSIAKIPEKVQIDFLPSVKGEEDFFDILQKNFEKDVHSGRTNSGSHRDDFSFILRNIPLCEGASRGETRTTLLALKKCEQQFVEKFSNSSPILLLDDVFSELDLFHQEHLIKTIQNSQAIITTTELHFSLEEIENVKIHTL